MIYIIEDSILKVSKIKAVISKIDKDRFKDIQVFGSFQSGLKAIEQCIPDLIILDMTIPTFDRKPNFREGRLRPLGGYDIMRKMKFKKLQCDVIVLTQLESFGENENKVSFEEITVECLREFPEIFKGSIYYTQGSADWEKKLIELISII